jgi:chromosome segregation ATPase
MPSISRIRFTNVIYENGAKRFNDDIFQFDGHNGALLIPNGGGKTVFVQTAIQAVLPHVEVANRKIRDTLVLENTSAHVAIEWILSEKPRRYGLTAVTLFMNRGLVSSLKYVYEYEENDENSIEKLPFVIQSGSGNKRPAEKEEMGEYYLNMSRNKINAHEFSTIKEYQEYIEKNFKIVPWEWRKIALINSAEGGVEEFFNNCRSTGQLVDNLLIPTVEEAIAGDGTRDFAETFEKQIQHFKKYKQLKARVEESRSIEAEIDRYVEVYRDYHNVNLKFGKMKKNVKAVYNFAREEQTENKNRIDKNCAALEELEREEDSWKQKESSYKLQLLKVKMEENRRNFERVSDSYNGMLNIRNRKQKVYERLRFLKYKSSIKIQNDKIKFLQSQLEEFNRDRKAVDTVEKIQDNSCCLRGYYVKQEKKLENERSLAENHLKNAEDKIRQIENRISKVQDMGKKLIEDRSRLEAKIEYLEEDMKSIEREILSNPEQESVEEEAVKWQLRIDVLENNIFECNKEIKSIEREKEDLRVDIKMKREELEELKREESSIGDYLEAHGKKQDALLKRVKEFKGNWFSFDSLYSKQETILQQLENKAVSLSEEKENLIIEERTAHRWADDYSDSEYYTADPVIEKWVRAWRNGFNYIESGTQYFQRAFDGGENVYPYWTISIITSSSETDKLKKKIADNCSKLSHPVIVMDENEARLKIEDRYTITEENIFFPPSWKKNIFRENFENWKMGIASKADESTKIRIEKEKEVEICRRLLMDVREFYEVYPYEQYMDMQRDQKSVKYNISVTAGNISSDEKRIEDIDDKIKELNNNIKDSSGEQNVLGNKIIKSRKYLNDREKKKKCEMDAAEIKEDILENNRKFSKLNGEKSISSKLQRDLEDNFKSLCIALKNLKGQKLYTEVLEFDPKYTSTSVEVLEDERMALKDILARKQKGRDLLEQKMKSAVELKNSLESEFEVFKNELEFPIDEKEEFIYHSGEDINKLSVEIKDMRLPLKNLKKKYDGAELVLQNSKNEYEIREKDFKGEYEDIISFSIPLERVPEVLSRERKNINRRKDYLTAEQESLEKQKVDIEKALQEIKVINAKYPSSAEETGEVTISEDIKERFPYKRMEVLKEMEKKLNEIAGNLDKKADRVKVQKENFIDFCQNDILDVKLKEMSVTGIEYNRNFEAILEWQNKMSERIMRIVKITEDDMRNHDREIQQFINQLHSYLKTISDELRRLPKSTRIKIDGKWKEVFLFTVPEWNEKEGRERLAEYIDWMLNQLQGDQFKDENGREDVEKVRKSIEKWLQSKQLLQYVMKQNTIKVKCRKVTNDGKMSSLPFSWETSNQWSGGEKWSKNMTLFLGILNYLAEKRIRMASDCKRHRAVIMDNPFGKASSEHVLDPVFFIAEQLGFQIIALTAHSEGKFIRTYFPIVYSCKLREASDGINQIMTKELEMKKAFFRDNDPQSLTRLT